MVKKLQPFTDLPETEDRAGQALLGAQRSLNASSPSHGDCQKPDPKTAQLPVFS